MLIQFEYIYWLLEVFNVSCVDVFSEDNWQNITKVISTKCVNNKYYKFVNAMK